MTGQRDGAPRITLQTIAVLRVLLDEPTNGHYGLEMARAAGLKSGTIYPILARLEQAGWITSAWEDIDPVAAGRRPRRYYQLTVMGTQRAQKALRDAQQLVSPDPVFLPGRPLPRGSPA
jgi:PadR family transcriptional regulator PadR